MNTLELDDDFQKHLQNDHYSFVAPVNPDLLEQFMKTVNQIAATSFFGTIHDALSNRAATRQTLQYFLDAELRVYIMISRDPSFLMHLSVEQYCEKMNIQYP